MDDDERARALIAEHTGWSEAVVEGVRRFLRDTGAGSWQLVRMSDAVDNVDRALRRVSDVDSLAEHDTAWVADHAELAAGRFHAAHAAAVAATREGRPADWARVGSLAVEAAAAWQALAGRGDHPWQVCAALHAAHHFREAQRQAVRSAT